MPATTIPNTELASAAHHAWAALAALAHTAPRELWDQLTLPMLALDDALFRAGHPDHQ